MTGPASAPRGERPGTPGTGWETELVLGGEELLPDGVEPPRANRATRRAAARRGGMPCGNNPNTQLTDGDRKVVDEFRAYLAARRTAALPDPATEETDRV